MKLSTTTRMELGNRKRLRLRISHATLKKSHVYVYEVALH